jgi:AraC family transcriptional activator of mtrCDE
MELTQNGVLPLRSNGSGKPDLDLLCGRFTCTPGPAALLLDTLPDLFHVSLNGVQPEGALTTIVALIRDETEHLHQGALTIVTALCHALFAMALRADGGHLPDTPSLLSVLADQRLGASVRAVFSAPSRRWTIEELAGLAAMSRPTYARRFKEAAGATVGDFVTGLRMAIASDLLLHTQRGVADIGVEVGYESEAAFGKAFRASKGLTPARYRQQQRLDRKQAGEPEQVG